MLECCASGNLYTVIIERHTCQHHAIRSVFIELLDGVHACHKLGVFHRDLNQENSVSIQDGLAICVADSGLATRSRLSEEFGVGGSYWYMDPECINCETNHTDIWSLGVIIANMVFGHNPWRVATSSDSGFLEYLHNVDFQSPSHFTTFRRYRIF
ncbi:kinase-like protein [Rhizopogon salebrosus TDB-379]|nr:kinase-like protein [Rhizopogon salebrosus TDB-379]